MYADAPYYSANAIRQHTFLSKLEEKIDAGETDQIIADLTALRDSLFAKKNLRVYVEGSIDKLLAHDQSPADIWMDKMFPGQMANVVHEVTDIPMEHTNLCIMTQESPFPAQSYHPTSPRFRESNVSLATSPSPMPMPTTLFKNVLQFALF